MSVLVWLVPPVVAVLLATAWTWWRGRPPRPPTAQESMRRYEQFRAALSEAERRHR